MAAWEVTSIEPMEAVAGPVHGFYVAAYANASQADAGGYPAYYKLFLEPVDSYFSASHCILKRFSACASPNPSDSLDFALEEAIQFAERIRRALQRQ